MYVCMYMEEPAGVFFFPKIELMILWKNKEEKEEEDGWMDTSPPITNRNRVWVEEEEAEKS